MPDSERAASSAGLACVVRRPPGETSVGLNGVSLEMSTAPPRGNSIVAWVAARHDDLDVLASPLLGLHGEEPNPAARPARL